MRPEGRVIERALVLVLALAVALGPATAFGASTQRESGPGPAAVVAAILPVLPELSQSARIELGRFLIRPNIDVASLAEALDATGPGIARAYAPYRVPPGALKPAVELFGNRFQAATPERQETAAEKLLLLSGMLSPSLPEAKQRQLALVAAQARHLLSQEHSRRVEAALKRIAAALGSAPADVGAAVAAIDPEPGKPRRWRLQPADIFLDGKKFADAVAGRIAGRRRLLSAVPRRGLVATLYYGNPWEKSFGGNSWQRGSKARKLWEWLLEQPDHSVTPDALLLKSFQLARGSAWRALTMSWDVLVAGRLSGGRERNYLDKTLKLADIRGDAALLPLLHDPRDRNYAWTSRADNFSAWYHFWGAMLAAFAYESARGSFFPVPGHWFSKWMIMLEEFFQSPLEYVGSWEWRAFLDHPKRLEIDVQGAVAGSRLAANLRALRGKPRDPEILEPYLLSKPAPFRLLRTMIELAGPVMAIASIILLLLVI